MQPTPLVSVLMPVYNGEKFIAEAIQSVLNQSYSHFELLICNDGSDDNTAQIIQSFDDNRICVFTHDSRLGIPVSRNELLQKSTGTLVAWLDADDIACPERIEKQVQFMAAKPRMSACFTDVTVFDDSHSYVARFPNKPALIKHILFFKQPVFFSSCMARKYEDIGFDLFLKRTQDFAYLWLLSQKGDIGIIEQPLVKYRLVQSAKKPDFDHTLDKQFYTQKQKLQQIGITCDDKQIHALNKFLRDMRSCNKTEMKQAFDILKMIVQSKELSNFDLEKRYLRAFYTYQVLKAVRFHSIFYLSKIKCANAGFIRDLIRIKV